METITLTIRNHRGADRLFAAFPYKTALINIIKKIKGATYSNTYKSWHFENTADNLKEICRLFEGVALVDSAGISEKLTPFQKVSALKEDLSKAAAKPDYERLAEILNSDDEYESRRFEIAQCPEPTGTLNEVEMPLPWMETKESTYSLEIFDKKLILKMPKNEADIAFLRLLKYSKWNNETFRWEIPNYKKNLELVKHHFTGRLTEIKTQDQNSKAQDPREESGKEKPVKLKPGTVLLEIVDGKKINLRFPFSKEHIRKIKGIPLYYWHSEGKYRSFPYTENIYPVGYCLKQPLCENYYISYGVNFKTFNYAIETKQITTKDTGKKEKKNYGSERKIPKEYVEKMTLLRNSKNTVRTYTTAFSDFINYYANKELHEITQDDIKNFLLYLIEKRKVSPSYQNQVINAIHPVGFLKYR